MSTLIIRFGRSAAAGGISALVNLGGLYLLTEYAGWHYLSSSAGAFLAALCVNYLLQRFWVFAGREQSSLTGQFVRYALLVATNFVLNLGGLYFLTEYAGLWYMGSQFLVTLVLTVANFAISDRLIFADRANSEAVVNSAEKRL